MNILFLCTGNSCRSQMADALAKSLGPSQHTYYSAGIEKHGLNPMATKVLEEIDIDINGLYSKTIDEVPTHDLDIVITVCSHADETCPTLPGVKVIHHGFDDPPKLAQSLQDEEEKLAIYRRVRDEIKLFISELDSIISER